MNRKAEAARITGQIDGTLTAMRAIRAGQPSGSLVYDQDIKTTVTTSHDSYQLGTWIETPGVVFVVKAVPHTIMVECVLTGTRADAEAISANFPKSVKLTGTAISGIRRGDDDNLTQGYLYMRVQLGADGVNKGANETGLKRYRSFLRHAERLGYTVTYNATAFGNSLTADQLAAVVAG